MSAETAVGTVQGPGHADKNLVERVMEWGRKHPLSVAAAAVVLGAVVYDAYTGGRISDYCWNIRNELASGFREKVQEGETELYEGIQQMGN